MEIFLDSADIDEVAEVAELGICDGVTTNPSLIAKQGRNLREVIGEIVRLIDGPVSAEVVATDTRGMLSEAEKLSSIHENIVIKLPLTPDGLKACRILSGQGIRTNVTLCFQPAQALLAAKVGATYISPFVGRLDDVSTDGMALIESIRGIYDNYEFHTKILVASVRHSQHITQAAELGADVVTAPFKVIRQLYNHPLTEQGLAQFLLDWEKAGQGSIT